MNAASNDTASHREIARAKAASLRKVPQIGARAEFKTEAKWLKALLNLAKKDVAEFERHAECERDERRRDFYMAFADLSMEMVKALRDELRASKRQEAQERALVVHH